MFGTVCDVLLWSITRCDPAHSLKLHSAETSNMEAETVTPATVLQVTVTLSDFEAVVFKVK